MRYSNNDNVSNSSYINKDFLALWEELLTLIPKLTNKWNPIEANESDPLAVLLKVLAVYSDKLNYNIDKSILERFPQTLTELRSAKNVYDALGYKAPWWRGGITTLRFTYHTSAFETSVLNINAYKVIVPRFTMVCDEDRNIVFTTLEDVVFAGDLFDTSNSNYSSNYIEVKAIQGLVQDYIINGVERITANNLDSNNRLYFLEPNVAENGIYISTTKDMSESNSWHKVDNIYQVIDPLSYEFGIDPVSGACYIEFANSIANRIESGLYIKYITTDGELGNAKAKSINSYFTDLKLLIEGPESFDDAVLVKNCVSVINASAVINGSNPATIDEMYINYKKVRNTFDTLVTILDYENYIYRFEDANGQNIVSNIRVSDRTNDLYDSYKILTLGEVDLITKTKVVQDSDNPKMTAFDIKLYPFNPIKSGGTTNEEDYDYTFENKSFNNSTSTIVNAIDNVKVVVHDIKDTPLLPIIVNYSLIGQIYLSYRVSKKVANEILETVKSALYTRFNSRNIEYGQEISYQDVIDAIKNADNRINYVALLPITYSDVVYPSTFNALGSANNISGDKFVRLRAILAGVTPWTTFDNYFQLWSNLVGGVTSNIAKLDSLIILPTGSFTTFTLAKNENLVAYAPLFKDVVTYSNYLYYTYTNDESNSESTAASVSKNSVHMLTGGETIKFYETSTSESPIATIDANHYVKPNFDLSDTSDFGRLSLNNGKLIAEVTRIQDVLTKNKFLWITNSELAFNLLALNVNTNNDKRYSQIQTNVYGYTLLTGEYFIFKDTGSSSFTLLGEGTTLYRKLSGPIVRPDSFNSFKYANWEDYIQGIGLTDNIGWSVENGKAIEYILNLIVTFGEGYTFKYTDGNIPVGPNGWSGNWKEPFILSPTGGNILQYYYDDESKLYDLPTILDGDHWTAFLRLGYDITNTVDTFKLVLELDLNNNSTGHNLKLLVYTMQQNEQQDPSPAFESYKYYKLEDNFYKLKNDEPDDWDEEYINYYTISSTPTNISSDNGDKYVQANLMISSPGGVEITLANSSGDIPKGINLYAYSYKMSNNVPPKQLGTQLAYYTEYKDVSEVKITLSPCVYAIFGVLTSEENLNINVYNDTAASSLLTLVSPSNPHFLICKYEGFTNNNNNHIVTLKPTANNKFTNIKITQIKLIQDANAKYGYNLSSINSLLNGSSIVKELTEEDLGDIEFDVVYNIPQNVLIEDPTTPAGLFNSNNPINRYVIPKIKSGIGLENLRIAELSINS